MKTGWCRKWKRSREIYYFDSSNDFDTEDFALTLHEMIDEVMEEEGKKGVLILCTEVQNIRL